MSVPLNQQDYERFKKLAEAIMLGGNGEISIYTSSQSRDGKCYASIEMKSSKLSAKQLEEIFNCTLPEELPEPLKLDEY